MTDSRVHTDVGNVGKEWGQGHEVEEERGGGVWGRGKKREGGLIFNSIVQNAVISRLSSVGDKGINLAKVIQHIGNQLLTIGIAANIEFIRLCLDAILLL